jgi:hypothetical protein
VRISFFGQFSMDADAAGKPSKPMPHGQRLMAATSRVPFLFFCLHLSAVNQAEAVRKMGSKNEGLMVRGMLGRGMGTRAWPVILHGLRGCKNEADRGQLASRLAWRHSICVFAAWQFLAGTMQLKGRDLTGFTG